jgi:glutathione S-transferase
MGGSMLTFYYNPVSSNACRVWIALLEKQIPFEPILVNLDGDQFDPDFTAVNPLQRVPVIVDDGFRVIESLAILDYLDAKYPTPSFMPSEPDAIAIVRMVEMLVINELQPVMLLLTRRFLELGAVEPRQIEVAQGRITAVMRFLEELIDGRSYFVGETFTQADIVGGIAIVSLGQLGCSMDDYPGLKAWSEQLALRDSWRQVTPSPEAVQAALPNVQKILRERF